MDERVATIRVLLLDDHQMFVDSVARLLAREEDIEVVGVTGTMTEAIGMAAQTRPDVVVVDYRLQDGDGVEAARRIRAASPASQILMLTGMPDPRILVEAIDAGCCGFVTKDKALDQLIHAVRLANAGESYIEPSALASLLPRLRSGHHVVGSDLTPREREVLQLMAEGLDNEAIAGRLILSVHTIRNHVQNILVKLDAHSKLEAVAVATREGLLRQH